MIALFTGGSGSGKSEMAELYACRLAAKKKPLYYFATMRVWGGEGRARVEKHRRQREGKGFATVECPSRLPLGIAGGVILLECLSNRLANAMFGDNEPDSVELILSELSALAEKNDLVVVTNEIFSDGAKYDAETAQYIENLGLLNQKLARRAQLFVESVYSIPVVHKGTLQ